MRGLIEIMLDLKLDIKSISDFDFVKEKREMFSFAVRHIYKSVHYKEKVKLINEAKKKFGLNDIEARSAYSEAKMRFDQAQSAKEETERRIEKIEKELGKLGKKKSTKDKDIRRAFKLHKRLAQLDKSLAKDITFGAKSTLERISYLSNFKGKTLNLKNGNKIDVDKDITDLKKKYKNQRIGSIYLLGEANQHGNRFFDFDFDNHKIIYKPKKGIKIEITYSCPNGHNKLFEKLKELIENKEIAITVRIEHDEIHLYYDNSIVSGFRVNEKARQEEVREAIKNITNEKERNLVIKEIYKKYYRELDEKMLTGKNRNRIFAVDQNPDFIGCCILERSGKKNFKILYVYYYDLRKINKKLPKSSTAKQRQRQSNKRKHGINHIWQDIFCTIAYFRCGYFASEDFDFKQNDTKTNAKDANRKIKNIWHRELSAQLIEKYTTNDGIIHRKINACYTSTIGNLMYGYTDPVNAAIEIGRRGLFQFEKDAFYPDICAGTIDYAMSKLIKLNPKMERDVSCLKDCTNWVDIHKAIFRITGLRYRASLEDACLIHNGSLTSRESTKLKHSKITKTILSVV